MCCLSDGALDVALGVRKPFLYAGRQRNAILDVEVLVCPKCALWFGVDIDFMTPGIDQDVSCPYLECGYQSILPGSLQYQDLSHESLSKTIIAAQENPA